MKLRVFLYAALAASVLLALQNAAFAQDFPRHDAICVKGVVSKPKLASAFLSSDPKWEAIYQGTLENDDAVPTKHQPRWQGIFAEDPVAFCKNNPACIGPDPDPKYAKDTSKKPPLNTKAAIATLGVIRRSFDDALVDNTLPGKSYTIANPGAGVAYFENNDQIKCAANEPLPAPKPAKIALPFRLRANSDDLNIVSTDPSFKSVNPATLNFKRDGTTTKTDTAALQATIGVPIELDHFAASLIGSGSDTFSGEMIPYISASQSISKVDGKPSTLATTNNVALGTLFSADATFSELSEWDHFFTVKPQYLWNTKDKSELASVRFRYQPWSNGVSPAINTIFPLSPFGPAVYVQLLFDLRNDVGEYHKKGIDPVTSLTNTSYDRAGSQFGFAISTDPNTAHLTLRVTETTLYGFYGSFRQLNQFQSTLNYYFDSTSNFAFTLQYTKGQDEDTAVASQTVMAGLSAKF